MKLSLPSQPRLLIIKMSSLGDLFHALPAVHDLKEALGATVDWVTQPEYAELVEHFTDVDRVIVFPRKKFLQSAWWFLRSLRQRRYDAVIDLQGLMKSAFVACLARSRFRIGPSYHREGAHLFYTHVAGEKNKNRHAIEEALDVVRLLGINPEVPEFPVDLPVQPVEGSAKRVALVPCSRWDTKNWSPNRFIRVANLLADKHPNLTFLIIGASADRAVCDEVEKGLSGYAVNLCGKTSLEELGGILRAVDLVLTVDSGPMHMAAALGTRVLAVFGATDPVRTGPYGNAHKVITVNEALDCRPCHARLCSRNDLQCLKGISVESVAEAALEMLEV